MADTNTTTQQPGTAPRMADDDKTIYRHYDASSNASQALEMGEELLEEADRLFCLASAIKTQLTPPEGKNPVDLVALRLVELLEDRLCDAGQRLRLISCLTVLQEQLNTPSRAPVVGHA